MTLRGIAALGALAWAAGRLSTRRERRRLQWDADHDDLTGLLNRAGLRRAVADLAAGDHGRGVPAALLLVDLDRFKEVNDRYGHATGDALLVAIARRLRTLPEATVARLAGDEFAVLVPLRRPPRRHRRPAGGRGASAANRTAPRAERGTASPGAGGAPDDVRAAVGRLLTVPHQLCLPGPDRTVLHVRASIGLAATDHLTTDLGQLLTVADAAMYAAKRRREGCAPRSVGAGIAGPGADAAPPHAAGTPEACRGARGEASARRQTGPARCFRVTPAGRPE